MEFELDTDEKDLASNTQKLVQALNEQKIELELQEDELIRTSHDLTVAQRRFDELSTLTYQSLVGREHSNPTQS